MTDRISDTDARRLTALAGVALSEEATRNAATAVPLDAAGKNSQALAFEAEPAQFVAVQRRCKS